MKKWVTEIRAIDPSDGKLKSWQGPHVDANTKEEGEEWCRKNAGYLSILGEFVGEIDWDDVKCKASRWRVLPQLLK